MLVLAAVLGSAGPPARRSAAQDPGPVLDGASAAFARVHTLSADFVQIITNPMIGEPDTTRGTLYQRKPSAFAMRFTEPRNDRIVADGKFLWIYTPSTTPDQVIRSAIPATGTTGPNLIGQFVDHARERYDAEWVRGDSAADVVKLVPKASDLPYQQAVLWISRSDSLVRRLDITESSGQLRTVVLRDLRVNTPVPDREFKFSAPKGVHVVTQ